MAKNEIQKQSWFQRLVPDFIAKAFAPVKTNPKAPEHGASWSMGNGVAPTFSPRQSMAVYAKHAYTNACVSRASQDIASLDLKLLRGKGEDAQELDSHPALELFRQPSSIVDGYLFREQFIVDLMMTGNCYTLIVGPLNNPTSLYRLHPENVRIVPDPVKMIQGYEYTDGGQSVIYPPERILHIRNASWDIESRGELYGSGLVEALNEEITADINAQRMASSVSKQGRPDVLISPVDPADIWDRRRRQEITQAYKAMTEHGGAMALSGQIKVETLNLSPRDLEFQALRAMVRENISAVCGVPSTVLGLPDANYATARQATITYWEIQQKRARKLEQFLTRVARLYDPTLYVQIDFSEVDALQAMRTEKMDRVIMHIDAGMTASQAYAYEGLNDSPFTSSKEEEEQPQSVAEEKIQRALTEMFVRAKEDDLAKVGNMREAFDKMPKMAKTSIEKKTSKHNEEVGDNPAKRTSKFRLAVVFWRGVGAFKTNPSSVRPSVSSAEQWGLARVNSFLYVLKNGKFRKGKHDTDLLPKEHPLKKKEEDSKKDLDDYHIRGSVGDKDPTNFPEDGDNQQVALRNSDYARFPWQEALDLKDNFPEIWDRGGNILGNKQFNRLLPIARRDSSVAQTETEEKAIRLREAWSARHFRDHRLAGVVAQIKWLMVGSRGLAHMREVISNEKKRLAEQKKSQPERTEEERKRLWDTWNERSYLPAERQMRRASEIYLNDAAKRYARYGARLYDEMVKQGETKAISFSTLLGKAFEIEQITKVIGRAFSSIYLLTGNDQVEELYRLTGRSRRLDFDFVPVEPEVKLIKKFAQKINHTTQERVKKIVRDGIRDGLSNTDIAKRIEEHSTFGEKRANMIAQTETTKAINGATNDAYLRFEEEEGIKVYKQWIASNDDRVREEHKDLGDKEPIPANEKFVIGSYSAMSPSMFGEGSMDINCRCTIAPVVREE